MLANIGEGHCPSCWGNNVSLAEEMALSHLAPTDARFIGMLCFVLFIFTEVSKHVMGNRYNRKLITYQRYHPIMNVIFTLLHLYY